jgi:pimeloyl-ACP methyl ester carboxylesterase
MQGPAVRCNVDVRQGLAEQKEYSRSQVQCSETHRVGRSRRSCVAFGEPLRQNEHVSDDPEVAAYLGAEAQIFAGYSLKPQVRHLRLQKPTLVVRAIEVGAGEAALFLHGYSLCAAHWAPLMSRLPSLHSVAIDMPGHAGSGAVDYNGVNLRNWFKQMLSGCLDELGLTSVHVIGHSQGAMIGMWLALDLPERVRSLVAIGTPAVALGAHLDQLRVLARPGIGPLVLSMAARYPLAMFGRMMAANMGRHAVESAPELVRAAQLAQRRPGYGTTVSTYLREMFNGARSEPPRYVLSDAELARLERPLLIIWGKDDDHFQSIAEARSKAALIPNARLEEVPGGHEPWLDDLDKCAAGVAAFLSSA